MSDLLSVVRKPRSRAPMYLIQVIIHFARILPNLELIHPIVNLPSRPPSISVFWSQTVDHRRQNFVPINIEISYFSRGIITAKKAGEWRLVEHAERCGKIRNADKLKTPERKGPLRISSHSLNDNINMELR